MQFAPNYPKSWLKLKWWPIFFCPYYKQLKAPCKFRNSWRSQANSCMKTTLIGSNLNGLNNRACQLWHYPRGSRSIKHVRVIWYLAKTPGWSIFGALGWVWIILWGSSTGDPPRFFPCLQHVFTSMGHETYKSWGLTSTSKQQRPTNASVGMLPVLVLSSGKWRRSLNEIPSFEMIPFSH